MIFEKQIGQMYKRQFNLRCDDEGWARYFSEKDFPGLQKTPFYFENADGAFLNGGFYHYGDMKNDRVVVFDHGFGGGHRSYMKEIQRLCLEGYTVFSYDHTGCMTSRGESTCGLGRSLSDLDACFASLTKDERFQNTAFSVIGHSWGGFSAMNIVALYPQITHVVVFAGFVSVKRQIDGFFGGIMKGYRSHVFSLEREANGKYAEYDGIKSLSDYQGRVLLVYSEDDKLVSKKLHFDPLFEAFRDHERIAFRLEQRKGHNPNYTEDAVKKLQHYLAVLKKEKKKKQPRGLLEQAKFIASFDWQGMTEQDENVWQEVFKTLACE